MVRFRSRSACLRRALAFSFALILPAQTGAHAGEVDRVEGLPASLRLDQVRILGSHNSYKPFPDARAEHRIRTLAPDDWNGLAYGHPPLETQLSLGIRQIEIDVAPDPDGGRYAEPYLMTTPQARAEMTAPGAKVLHVAGVDTGTHCLTFRDCLTTLRRWSDAHPGHLPITVLVNANTFDAVPGFRPFSAQFDAATLDSLDRDILTVIGRDRMIVPDQVRGDAATLADAVRAHRWPTLGEAKGKLLFVFDAGAEDEDRYRQGRPSLKGRAMFGYYPESAAEASIFNIQDPRGQTDRIQQLVRKGFLVRTRTDANTAEARAKDYSRRDAAVASGAQYISTDYYDGAPDPLGLGFRVTLPGGWWQCDPVTAPRCDPSAR
ncbi:Ca2+-dependent phosphoinositide-specific phospholipase C [Stakelama pacifica]|uniref:Calcium-dependent phosphoinositide phospholipase C n=1 Tax=Stakelama pacifica TaxID=517720 RepID=A0A4V3BTD0_9SPHN|nr:Ca2+-dependent phosphoinositide-specific phospholipase C [Stakelama pacifica]TDN82898.1 calcium-dependent phosphoinositide phospholipase C [Stakelama pacifica]GGO95266.1 hypothetical protein GCM10011329_19050 [Stakelama pacifica]